MMFNRPKGTRDFAPGQLGVRQALIALIEGKLKDYGFSQWDGPIFEHLETLTQKSGEAIKEEIYTFSDKADRQLALRFELTASLARIISQNNALPKPIKAYNYGKVFRYEKPQAGRYREFLQFDADVFGSESVMVEVELLLLANSVMGQLNGIGDYHFNINNRGVISAYLAAYNIDQSKHNDICRILDKKGKISTVSMSEELVALSIDVSAVDRLVEMINMSGSNDEKLDKMERFLITSGQDATELDKMRQIIEMLQKVSGGAFPVVVDYSLIRGLGYYTGTIYETILCNDIGVGVVGGGGRYDNLVGVYGCASSACGISFGLERLIDIIESKANVKAALVKNVKNIYVACSDAAHVAEAIKLTESLRSSGVAAEYDINQRNYKKQQNTAYDSGYKWLVSVDERILSGKVSIKNLLTKVESVIDAADIYDIINRTE